MIMPSINFAAEGPRANAKETNTVDMETRRVQGFKRMTLITGGKQSGH